MTTLIPQFDLKNGGSTPTGAINRAINLKLQEFVSVLDFGADSTVVSLDYTKCGANMSARECGTRDLEPFG